MKSFLSKYWKNILIYITLILIFLNIVHKCVVPHILVDEFAKYGPDVEVTKSVIKTGEMASAVKSSVPVPDNIFKLGVILIVGLIAAVIISDLANKAPAKKK